LTRVEIEILAHLLFKDDWTTRAWSSSEERDTYRAKAIELLNEPISGYGGMVDTEDLKSSEDTRTGSSPVTRTKKHPSPRRLRGNMS
jgi:hypothetical protein